MEDDKGTAQTHETIRTVAKTVDSAIDLVRGVGRVFGPAADELAGMMGEQMRFWRFRNMNRIVKKTEQLLDERKIHQDMMGSIPFGESIRLIEAASLEDSDEIQDVWARLLANALDSSSKITVKKVYIDIINSLSPIEATFLDLAWEFSQTTTFGTPKDVEILEGEINKKAQRGWRRYKDGDRSIAIQNLMRARCITLRPKRFDSHRLVTRHRIDDHDGYNAGTITSIDERQLIRILNEMSIYSQISAGVAAPEADKSVNLYHIGGFHGFFGRINVPEMNYMLTPLGDELMKACALPKHDPGKGTSA